MKFCILAFGILVILVSNSSAQNNPTPTPSPQGQNRTTQTPRTDNRGINDAFNNLRSLELLENAKNPNENVMRDVIEPIYRKPSKKELESLTPSQNLLTQYEKILQQPETGIFKLSANCVANAQVLTATENCLSNNVVGAGTAYSFRLKSHWLLHLSDLVLEKNVIRTGSLLQQGILVNLGNIELDEISMKTAGLKFLLDFQPVTKEEEVLKLEESLSKGIKADGFIYSFGLYVKDKTTFALRSVAYRGKFERTVSGVKYNELEFDKRKDVVVVFRVVEKSENGDITIIWKEIFRKDSPVIKVNEKDK